MCSKTVSCYEGKKIICRISISGHLLEYSVNLRGKKSYGVFLSRVILLEYSVTLRGKSHMAYSYFNSFAYFFLFGTQMVGIDFLDIQSIISQNKQTPLLSLKRWELLKMFVSNDLDMYAFEPFTWNVVKNDHCMQNKTRVRERERERQRVRGRRGRE